MCLKEQLPLGRACTGLRACPTQQIGNIHLPTVVLIVLVGHMDLWRVWYTVIRLSSPLPEYLSRLSV